MELPLTPLEFARRTRKLYPEREAVVVGELRLTYDQFFRHCDRWSAALQALGVKQGDRVAYIAPNTHAQLESFYAVLENTPTSYSEDNRINSRCHIKYNRGLLVWVGRIGNFSLASASNLCTDNGNSLEINTGYLYLIIKKILT